VNDQPRSDIARTRAEVRRGWWPGWIWAIPIAAVLIVGWWAFRTFMNGGETITISFDDAHGLKPGDTSVLYRGMKIGKAKSLALAKDGKSIEVTVHIDDVATQFLRSGTQFWLRGAHPSLSDLSTLSAVVSGPSIIMDPGPGKKATHFAGLARKPIVSGPHGPPQIYGVSLQGDAGRLKQGDPVKLRGFTVGEVKDVEFRYDPATGAIETPVTLALYPPLLHLGGDAALTAAIDRLIREGLRARLKRDPPLIGDPQVALEMDSGAPGVAPSAIGGVPQIPAASGGGVASIVARVNKLPLDRIAQNLLDVTRHADQIAASPALKNAIVELDAALAQIRETTQKAGPQISALVERLRKTAGQLDSTAGAADRLLGGSPAQTGLQTALRELTDAARSVRDLANYLDRHPEALIHGRSGD
jgi:paraquat-inducible protein B